MLCALALGAALQQPRAAWGQALAPPAVKKALESMLKEEEGRGGNEELLAGCRSVREDLQRFVEAHRRAPWDELEPHASLDSPAKLGERIDQLNTARTVDEQIRHLAEFLLRYPEHPEFAARLWNLATAVSLREQVGALPMFDARLLPVLFRSFDHLPHWHPVYLEGKLLSARHHHHAGEFGAEERVLRQLLDGDLPPQVRVAARSLMGRCLEAQGRFGDALELYATFADELDAEPAAHDALLRAALIDLTEGRPGKARSHVKRLAAGDASLRKLASNGPDIETMVALEEAGDLLGYWKAAGEWWPQWLALRSQLGREPLDAAAALPDFARSRLVAPELAAALVGGDEEGFYNALDAMLAALRCSPSMVAEAGMALTFLVPSLTDEQQQEVHEFILTAFAAIPEAPERLRRHARLYLTLAYSETGRPAEALEVAEAFRAADVGDDELSETMLRLWTHLRLEEGGDLEEPRAELEAILRGGRVALQNRPQTALYLARIYAELGLEEEEEALLERELRRSETQANAAIAAGFTRRLRELQGRGEGEELAAAVAEWRSEHAPGWLRFALPDGLESEKLGDKEVLEVLSEPEAAGLGDEERLAFELAVAEAGDIPTRLRERAFQSAFLVLHSEVSRHSEARKMLRDVLRDERFSETLRQYLLVYSLDDALARGRKREITEALTHPLFDTENPRLAEAAEAFGRFASTDLDDPEALMECYRAVAEGGLTGSEMSVVGKLFERLLAVGAFDEADALRGDIEDWELGADVEQDKAGLRLAFLRAAKAARAAAPFGEAMRALVERSVPADLAPPPPGWMDYREALDLRRFADRDALGLLLQRARGADLIVSPRFWGELAELLPRDAEQVEFAFAYLDAVFDAELADIDRSFAVFGAPSVVDTDDPAQLERLLALFDRHRDPQAAPFTHAAMRVVEVQSRDLRAGKVVDLDSEWGGLEHPALANVVPSARLRALMARRDVATLRSLLEAMPADRLLAPELIDLSWPALRMVGLDDEAELAGEAAAHLAVDSLPTAARTLDFGLIHLIYDVAERAGQPGLIPAGWFEYLDAEVEAERDRYSLRIRQAELLDDSEEVARWAGKAVQEFPTYYNYYRPYGEALARLGKDEAAIAALEVYTRYSKDEVEWQDAVELLDTLREE